MKQSYPLKNGIRFRSWLTADHQLCRGTPAHSTTCFTVSFIVRLVESPCRYGTKRSAELERTVLPANSGNRLISRITFARPTTGWVRTPVPATKLKPEIYTTLCWKIFRRWQRLHSKMRMLFISGWAAGWNTDIWQMPLRCRKSVSDWKRDFTVIK